MAVLIVHPMPQQGLIRRRLLQVHQAAVAVQVPPAAVEAVAVQVVQAGAIKS